jgi:Tetraspanin family
LLFVAYGLYLTIKASETSFSYAILINGGAMTLMTIAGYFTVGQSHMCCTQLYSTLLVLLFAAHTTLAIFCLAEKDKVLDWIKKESAENSNEKIAQAEKFARDHVTLLGWIAVVVAGIEFLCVLIVCCARRTVMRSEQEEFDDNRDDFESRSKAGSYHGSDRRPLLVDSQGASSHPKTDKRRAELRAKYGDDMFGNSSSNNGTRYV